MSKEERPSSASGCHSGDVPPDGPTILLRERFVFRRVWTAFDKLHPDHAEYALVMFRHLFGVVLEPFDRMVRPIISSYGDGPGPYWDWREFPQLSGSQLVSVHPLNGNPPYILDFAIPNSGRPRMTMFERRVPPGFDPRR